MPQHIILLMPLKMELLLLQNLAVLSKLPIKKKFYGEIIIANYELGFIF